MVESLARIDLWGKTIGAVAWDDSRGYATVEFTDAYYNSPWDIAPLQMPKDERRIFSFPGLPKNTFLGLPGLLADALPDRFGNQVLDAWLTREGRSINQVNPVERLLYMGKRGMGALEFQPVKKDFPTPSESLEIESLISVANEVVKERESFSVPLQELNSQAMAQLIQVGTSAGGARAKAVLAINPQTKEIRSGQLELPQNFEHWIIKFDGVNQTNLKDPQGYGRIEYAYHKMAEDCGIQMMPCELWEENGRAHFLTKRFDRANGEKLHIQSLCAIAHFDYNNPNTYSYEQAFQTMRRMRMPFSDAEEQFKRMVFNVLSRNCDDHTKNISFVMDQQGKWGLSPAYDMTFAYNPSGQWTRRHQMAVNGKREKIDMNDLLEIAGSINLKKGKEIIRRNLDVLKNWKTYAREAGVPGNHADQISTYHITSLNS